MASFDYASGTAFLRDSFVPFKDASLNIASSPVLYGLAVYTVFSVNKNPADGKGYIFRLSDHYTRLVNSAAIMGFEGFAAAWPYDKFEGTMLELLQKNGVASLAEDVLVRVSVFVDAIIAGTKIHGQPIALSAYVYPMGQILPLSGIDVCVSSWRRNADDAIPSRAKVNGGYVNVCLMKNEAILNGYDDAIALDRDGHVTEGTVANLFLVRNGALVTPHAGADILEGITRDSIVRIARDLGMNVVERQVDRTELYIADEAFVCGSSARIVPIKSIDKRPLGAASVSGAAAPGPFTAKLAQVYETAQRGSATTGALGLYPEWRKEVK